MNAKVQYLGKGWEQAELMRQRAEAAEKSFNDTLEDLKAMMQERDELRRQLEQAQNEIRELHAENGLKLKQIFDLEEILYATRIIETDDGSSCWCIEDAHIEMCERARNATKPLWSNEAVTA